MNRLAGWGAAVLLLGASAALVAVTPTDLDTPFELTGRMGDRIPARLAEVEVLDVRLAERLDVTYDDEIDGSTSGVWMIVDARVTPTQRPLNLHDSAVRIGGVTYRADDALLGSESMLSQPFGAGIALEGSFIFELPRAALDAASTATIVIATTSDARLDSVPAVIVDLDGLEVLRSVDIGLPVVPDGDR